MSIPAQGAEGAETMTAVDWDHLNDLFSRMPSGPWDARRDTDGHEIRQIDTDPTNKHHWPFRLCRSIPGQHAKCDGAVFDFLAGVLNAWPQIVAERSEEAEIERILAMPEDELRKRCLVDGQSPEQSVQIADLAFECASLRAALIQIGQQYVTHRGDMTDGDALEAIRRLVDRALSNRKEVSGQNMSLSTLQGQTANAEVTGVEPGAAALASPRTDSDERTAGVLWSAWPEDDCDSDPRVDPMAQKVTEWFVGRWPVGADEPECRILIGAGRSAEIIARRIAEKLTSVLNTDAIQARKAATPAQPAGAVPDSLRALSEAVQREAILSQGSGAKLQRLRQEYAEACMDWVGSTLFASHPAGQSAGSGDWSEHSPQEIVRRTRCMADETRDPVVWRDCCDLILERLDKPAPDSTRTGDERAEELTSLWEPQSPAEWLEKAERHHRKGINLGVLHEELPRLIAVFEKALAARPAAPEGQGAWSRLDAARDMIQQVDAILFRPPPPVHPPTEQWCEEYAEWHDAYVVARSRIIEADKAPAPPASSGQGGR